MAHTLGVEEASETVRGMTDVHQLAPHFKHPLGRVCILLLPRSVPAAHPRARSARLNREDHPHSSASIWCLNLVPQSCTLHIATHVPRLLIVLFRDLVERGCVRRGPARQKHEVVVEHHERLEVDGVVEVQLDERVIPPLQLRLAADVELIDLRQCRLQLDEEETTRLRLPCAVEL